MSSFAQDFAEPPSADFQLGIRKADGNFISQLSPSAISLLFTCPEKFRLTRLLQRPEKASGAIVLGSAYHHARQLNYEQKLTSGKDLPLQDVFAAYDQGWGLALAAQEIVWGKEDAGALKTLGAEMVKIYHRKLSPRVQPIAVEERFAALVPGVPLALVGRVDVIDEDGTIIDTKTDKEGATQPRPEWRVQALCYMAAFPEHDFAWHVHSKSGTLRLYWPEKYPKLRLGWTPAKRRTAELVVRGAWDMLSDFYRRYGLEQPWPGTALTNPYACRQCSQRSSCVWQA